MAIKFERKAHVPVTGNKRSYIAIFGDLREDIGTLAAWSGKTMQQVGFELLQQAVNEVIHKVPKNFEGSARRDYTRREKK
jgi:TRAP-type mannitol/chloroaromatic compound transport system permease small subunit